ncbi:MAG: hypothetical protein ACLRMZ_02195 [Blautia marasmi]
MSEITLNGDTIQSESGSAEVSGSTITISGEGIYRDTGNSVTDRSW